MALNFLETQRTLANTGFSLYLHRRGKFKGHKDLRWFDVLSCRSAYTTFRPGTAFEEIVDFALEISPRSWQGGNICEVGMEVEFLYSPNKRIRALVLEVPSQTNLCYLLQSEHFSSAKASFGSSALLSLEVSIVLKQGRNLQGQDLPE